MEVIGWRRKYLLVPSMCLFFLCSRYGNRFITIVCYQYYSNITRPRTNADGKAYSLARSDKLSIHVDIGSDNTFKIFLLAFVNSEERASPSRLPQQRRGGDGGRGGHPGMFPLTRCLAQTTYKNLARLPGTERSRLAADATPPADEKEVLGGLWLGSEIFCLIKRFHIISSTYLSVYLPGYLSIA